MGLGINRKTQAQLLDTSGQGVFQGPAGLGLGNEDRKKLEPYRAWRPLLYLILRELRGGSEAIGGMRLSRKRDPEGHT
jgi:hypothetical protein